MSKEITVFSLKKDSTAAAPTVTTPKSLDVLAQAIHVYRDRMHFGLARVKTRSEVDLTTKKVYRQKHTGGARHGSKRAPIFVGGGVTHGPKGVKRVLTLNSATRATAKNSALVLKIMRKEFAYLDLTGIKTTKEASALIAKTGAKSATVALSPENIALTRVFRNIKSVTPRAWSSLNAYEIVHSHMILVDSAVATPAEKPKKTAKETKVAKK